MRIEDGRQNQGVFTTLPDGSFVFELAPAWRKGTGTRSLFLYQLILELCGGEPSAVRVAGHAPPPPKAIAASMASA